MCSGYSLNLQKKVYRKSISSVSERHEQFYDTLLANVAIHFRVSLPIRMRRLWMTIASTPLTVSIGGTSCRFRKTTSYAILPLFFSYFLTARRVRACILLWKVEVSVYYLTTYVEKRPYHSSPRCRSATIRAPSACASSASFRENLRDRAFNSPFTESHR